MILFVIIIVINRTIPFLLIKSDDHFQKQITIHIIFYTFDPTMNGKEYYQEIDIFILIKNVTINSIYLGPLIIMLIIW